MPGLLVEAPGVTKRSLVGRVGEVRQGLAAARCSRSSNQVVSTLTHTWPMSIGVSLSAPSSRANSSAPAGRVGSYVANTPSSSGREAKVLSTPKATSPVGLSLVSDELGGQRARVAGGAA